VRLLLGAGADVAAERPGGFGPLHMLITAAQEEALPVHAEIAAALLDAGADPNQPTRSGKQTPVRNAAALGLVEILQRLLASGRADVDARDKEKATPISVAAESGGLAAVRALLEAGADPRLMDRYGRTPLHGAAAAGDLAVARVLVEAGVEVASATRFPVDATRAGSTAHDIASTLGHTELAAYLVQAAVDDAEDASTGAAPTDGDLVDLDAAVARFSEWLDILYDIHRAHSDPAERTSQRSRVKADLLPFYLDKDSWDGDAPFSPFANRLKPSVATKNDQDLLDQLGRRRLFKAERWSAPDVGGVVRCLVGRAHNGYATYPDLVFDLAEVGGTLRIIAMHDPCVECRGTGEVDGATCTHVSFDGLPCLKGLHFQGGLAFDVGEHESSRVIEQVPHETWRAYMER
jgi:hypothetical protein